MYTRIYIHNVSLKPYIYSTEGVTILYLVTCMRHAYLTVVKMVLHLPRGGLSKLCLIHCIVPRLAQCIYEIMLRNKTDKKEIYPYLSGKYATRSKKIFCGYSTGFPYPP